MPDSEPLVSTPKDPVCGMEVNPESPFRNNNEGGNTSFAVCTASLNLKKRRDNISNPAKAKPLLLHPRRRLNLLRECT